MDEASRLAAASAAAAAAIAGVGTVAEGGCDGGGGGVGCGNYLAACRNVRGKQTNKQKRESP